MLLPHLPHPQLLAPLPLLGVDERIKIPQLYFLPEFNLLAPYVNEKDTPLIDVLIFPSNAISRETTLLATSPSMSTATTKSSIESNKGL
jgi:hypothetical protein